MSQDSYFVPFSSAECLDVPQLSFPEPAQAALPIPSPRTSFSVPARPVATSAQFPLSDMEQAALAIPQLAFPEPAQLTPVPGQLSFPETGQPISAANQVPFPTQPANYRTAPSTHTPLPPHVSIMSDNPMQVPFPQPLPSTETINTAHIEQLWRQASTEKAAEASLSSLSWHMPGLVEMPFVTHAIQVTPGMAGAAEQGESKAAESALLIHNQDARRAAIEGLISFAFSLFSLITIAGFAGPFIGTFAIIHGIAALRRARRFPELGGRRLAILGISLGVIAWGIAIVAFVLRVPQSS